MFWLVRPAWHTQCRAWFCGSLMSSSKFAHFLFDNHSTRSTLFDAIHVSRNVEEMRLVHGDTMSVIYTVCG